MRTRLLLSVWLVSACGKTPPSNGPNDATGGTPGAGGSTVAAGGSTVAAGGNTVAAGGSLGASGDTVVGGLGGVTSGGTGSFPTSGVAGTASASGTNDTGGSSGSSAAGRPGGESAGGISGTGGSTIDGGRGGSTGTSGSAGTSGVAGSAGGASETAFALIFRDDFDSLDLSRWELMTHSWPGNLALFSPSSVAASGGMLTVRLMPSPSGTMDGGEAKPFLGAEVRSRAALTYGRVRARARFATGSAVVSALVAIYTPWPADNWNELDIECLGADPSNVQFNAMVYTGPLPAVAVPVSPTQHPRKVALGFDPSQSFHVYTIEWTPAAARFLVDDVLVHTWSDRIELMGLPQNTLLTIWASAAPDWAGPVTAATGQASATYDWVELYRYTGG